MATSTSSVLDAVRTGDLHTLEQTSDELLLRCGREGHPISEAANLEQWDVMWWLLDKAEQIGYKLAHCWTRAHCAAAQGDLELLRGMDNEHLIKRTSGHEECVHIAAMCGQVDAIEFIVRERGLTHASTSLWGSTPLHFASERGHVGAIEKLPELGAEMNDVDSARRSALSVAALAGQAEAMRCLLRLGCTAPPLVGYDSAMHYAARSGSVESVDVLLGHGSFDVEETGLLRKRPLHCAAQCGDVLMVEYLLALGAQVNAVDDHGWTVLHYAVGPHWKKIETDMTDVLRVLLVAGADRAMEDHQGKTARDLAQDAGYGRVVELLDEYWPITSEVAQVLLGMKGPTESPLTRFAAHALFEPGVLSLVKCQLTGEDKGAYSQLVEEVERG